jgi:hypothetical protein
MSNALTYALMAPVGAALIALGASAEPPAGEASPAGPDGQSALHAQPALDAQLPPELAMRLAQSAAAATPGSSMPKFDDVSKGYEKVTSTAEDSRSLYTVWKRGKDAQLLAELPRSFEKQLLFIAYTVAEGTATAGVQTGDMYAKWRRFDDRLALIEPNFGVRSTGDSESRKGAERVFTDRVILDVPIVAMGPGGGPVIDLDGLLIGNAARFFGSTASGIKPALSKITRVKAFPENVEVAFEVPMGFDGRLTTLYYSIKSLPGKSGYRPRQADTRIGFFTTTYRDVGDPAADTQWNRYINRWHLEKADPKLKMSPPKEPIIFYLEHTMPVRYRRWVRDGVLEWNKAFEKVGIVNAIEVYQQDARTGAHMDKDPEDARYNFILWTNSNMGFAIGPSRVDPRTGQILDADIVMDEGFVTSWVNAWRRMISEQAMEAFGPQTLEWLAMRPQWDPRVRLASPSHRASVAAAIRASSAERGVHRYGGHPAAMVDPTLLGDDAYDGLVGRLSQVNGMCLNAMSKSMAVAMFRLSPDLFAELKRLGEVKYRQEAGEGDGQADDDETDETDETDEPETEEPAEDDAPDRPDGDMLDGVPDWFIGPLLRDVIMHETGHTLGLRHNFKASTVYSLEQVNSEDFKGKAHTGSVMEYNPININFGDGPVQGDYTMVTLGPYDYWAIRYGYTFDHDLDPIVSRVAEAELLYATDEDTWGPDPTARRFDFGADPLEYAESQMRIVQHLRTRILDEMVEDGDSWAKAREAYEMLLGRHVGAVSIAANWIGGSYVNRDKKGDPDGRDPVVPVDAERQRRALKFVIDSTFSDEAFGLTPDLLSKMTIDKWFDEGGFMDIFEDPTWPVHDRIAGIQAAAMTMVLNPQSLARVLDQEYRVPAEEDALTLPEVLHAISDSIWSELESRPAKAHTARRPMVSSLRRNLQREHIERLIDLSLPNAQFGIAGRPISNLSTHYLRTLHDKLDRILERQASKLDPYTTAHFSEAKIRITGVLDAQFIYNTDDIGGGGGGLPFFFMEPGDERGGSPR